MELQQMQFRSVTFVLIEAILGKLSAKVTHDPVPGYLGDHAGGSDAQANAITIDNCGLREWEGNYRQTINQNVVRRFEQRFNREAHRTVAGAQDVDPIDFDGINNSDGPADCRFSDQFAIDFFAQFRRKLFGVIQATMTEFFRENHCGRYDWPRQRTATSFVNPRDARDSDGAQFFLVTKSAATVHPRKSLADLRE
jgi:hypothetical protein